MTSCVEAVPQNTAEQSREHVDAAATRMRTTYKARWKQFVLWCYGRGLAPYPFSSEAVHDFVLSIGSTAHSTVYVVLAAIREAYMILDGADPFRGCVALLTRKVVEGDTAPFDVSEGLMRQRHVRSIKGPTAAREPVAAPQKLPQTAPDTTVTFPQITSLLTRQCAEERVGRFISLLIEHQHVSVETATALAALAASESPVRG